MRAIGFGETANPASRVKADRQHQREEREAAIAKEKIKEGIRSQADPWLELTGWVPHLQGIPRAALLRAKQPKAFDSSQAKVVGRLTLEIIERREAGAESNERPFYSRHRVGTIKKYSQKLLLKQIARTADAAKKEQLEERCLRLWMALLDHTLLDDEHQSALLSGVAVLGLKPDHHGGGWVPAHEFSSTLSALITTSKALVVHYARCQREEALQKDANTAPTAYELVRDMADRFLKHPDNHLDGWQDWLLDRVLEEAPLRERFIRGIDNTQQPEQTLWRDNAVASFSKRVKTIYRYVPREVSELVVYFLGLGRPFIDDLQMLHNGVARPTAFL
ncbi:hypothetical protein CFE70_010652 [Pyrenophora teres f. teres 0-1]